MKRLLLLVSIWLLVGCSTNKVPLLSKQVKTVKCVRECDRDMTPNEMEHIRFGLKKKILERPKKNDWGEMEGEYKYGEDEPLEWLVLEKDLDNNKVLLMCMEKLAYDEYYDKEFDPSIKNLYSGSKIANDLIGKVTSTNIFKLIMQVIPIVISIIQLK